MIKRGFDSNNSSKKSHPNKFDQTQSKLHSYRRSIALLVPVAASEATFYNWKKKYGGLGPSELRRLRQLEEENAKLKRLVADLSLDKIMLQDVLSKKL